MFPVHNFCQALKKIFINPIRVFLCANSVVIVLQTFLIDTSTVEICRQLLGGAHWCKQPRRRRWQEGHKLSYLKMKSSSFARFAHAFFILYISQSSLNVLSTTWNDMFCNYVDDVSTTFLFHICCIRLGRSDHGVNSDDVNSRCCRRRPGLSSLFLTEEGDRNVSTGTGNFNVHVKSVVPVLLLEIETDTVDELSIEDDSLERAFFSVSFFS